MSVLSLAVIGKNRQPIYVKEFRSDKSLTNTDDDLQLFGISQSGSSQSTNDVPDENRISSLNYKDKSQCDCSTRQQFILHDAMDYMEQWIESRNTTTTTPPQQQQNAHDAMFAGLLCPIEDMSVYGMIYGDCFLTAFYKNKSLIY